ncbi:MAG: methyltransferase domain-containing protein [Halioglobus sp.]|nr:methyltransferase domain-containing protein [Halioglobus sp.]
MRADCIDILQELEYWYARGNGQYLMQVTRAATQPLLDTAFGYHILQLGVRGGEPLCQESPIHHRLYCASSVVNGVDLVAESDELPLESDSVDAVIVHHCLEFAANPHKVLREIQRVLIPQGQLLIIGFNPYSLLGCKARLRGLLRDPLWSRHRPVSERRLTDWLRLLGCEVLDTRRLYALPPLGSGRLHRALTAGDTWIARHNLPMGGIYILHATKQVVGLHKPRRLLLARRRRLIGLVPKPAAAPRSGFGRDSRPSSDGSHSA